MSANASLLLDEDRMWGELRATIDMFDDELAARPGYFAEGWSAKDALAHVGTWLAEAGAALVEFIKAEAAAALARAPRAP